MIGSEIANNARKKLLDFIKFEIKNLIELIGEKNEDYPNGYFDAYGILKLTYQVEVDNSYLDVNDTCYENRMIVGYGIDEDDNPYILDECDVTWCCDILMLDELVGIANALELSYLKEIKNN